MLDRSSFETWRCREAKQTRHLRHALHGRYRYLWEMSGDNERLLWSRYSYKLNFSNGYARARWMRSIGESLFGIVGAVEPNFIHSSPVYILTISDRRDIWLLDCERLDNGSPRNISLDMIKFKYELALGRIDTIGMIDVAPYVSAGAILGHKYVYHLHGHFIVWNRTRRQMKRMCRVLNRSIRSIHPDAIAVHWREIRSGDLRQVLWYCFKTPRYQYQMWVRPNGQHRQAKRRINGVNSIRVHAMMKGITLDELTVSSGEGARLLDDCKRGVSDWRWRSASRSPQLNE